MGKIRIKLVGEEEKKKERKVEKRTAKAPGLKDGERVASVPNIEELEKETEQTPSQIQKEAPVEKEKIISSYAKKTKQAKIRSSRYITNASLVKKDTLYSLDKALELLK